jgi:cytochrome oxidase Cu insertion factor (SCO1/SenC/PrrC family)
MRKHFIFLALVSLLLILAACSSNEENTEESNKIEENQIILNAKDINGNQVTLSDQNPTLIYFMAAWCPTCIGGEQVLKKVNEAYPNVQLITLDLDPSTDTKEDLAVFQQRFGGNWSHVLDDNKRTITSLFKVNQLEVMVLIDQNKQEVFRAVNPSFKKLQEELAEIGVTE